MADDLELNVRQSKLPTYEPIDGSAPSRRRRLVYFLTAVGVVMTIVAVSVYGATHTATATGTVSDGPAATKVDGPDNGIASKLGSSTTSAVCPLSVGTTSRRLNVGGIEREYKLIVPQGTSFPTSAVFAYHGISSDTATIENKMKLLPFQNTAAVKSLLIYPEAKNKGGNGLFDPAAFNGAACCKNSPDWNDEAFFSAIVDELSDNGCLNPAKVNVMGFSNGGFMTNRLACASATRSKVTAACVHSGLIGDYSGDLTQSPWKTCEPKPVMGIHGSSDNTVPIAGGKNPSPMGSSRWFSFAQTMGIWEASCSGATENTVGNKVTRTSDCGTHQVVSITHNGLAHDWHADSTADCMGFFAANGGI